jgi:phosphatidylglycerol:prolipoprotein diacylglycerol transferase
MSLFHPEYAISVGVAVALALLFPVTKHLRGGERRSYYTLQTITLLGAVLGAKLSVLLGDYDWPFVPMRDWHLILVSGRSVTGALILGFLAAETAKPLLGYRLPPNDRFATLLPFSCAIGRVGCLLAGCCRGIPWNGPWAITYSDGIPRHPAAAYELLFQLAVGLTFLALLRRGRLHGRLFSVYLIAYGAFRFGIEFLRETPKTWGPISAYQGLSLVMIALGTAFLVKRTFWPPETWQSSGPAPLAA